MAEPGSIRFLKERILGFDLPAFINNTLSETSNKAIQLNQIQLYQYSTDSAGNKLALYSLPTYAVNKNRLNPLPGLFHPDLYLTGSFFKGFKASVVIGGLSLTSTDEKTGKLTSTRKGGYGPQVFGLTKDNKQLYVRETYFPAFQEGFTAGTGLYFR